MSVSFTEFAAERLADGDKTPVTPAPEPAAAPLDSGTAGAGEVTPGASEGAPSSTEPSADAAPAGEPDFTEGLVDPAQLAPELQAQYKSMQAAFTKKTQALAEQRKQIEGLSSEGVQFLRDLERQYAQDPASAAARLEQVAQQVRARVQVAPDPFEQFTPTTVEGQLLIDEVRRLRAEQLGVQQHIQQQQLQAEAQRIEQKFGELERVAGRAIPEAERDDVARFCAQNQIRDVEWGWKALNWDKARQAGMDAGQRAVQQRAAAAPVPSPLATREGPVDEPKHKDLRSMLEWRLAQAGF